jgi:hypothetical protein
MHLFKAHISGLNLLFREKIQTLTLVITVLLCKRLYNCEICVENMIYIKFYPQYFEASCYDSHNLIVLTYSKSHENICKPKIVES